MKVMHDSVSYFTCLGEKVQDMLITVKRRTFSEWVNGGFMSCQYLRPYSGREHTVYIRIHSGDDDIGKKKVK